MGRGGFEPPKQIAADLQSVPFGHSGICPFKTFNMKLTHFNSQNKLRKADDRTRTDNLLITNQLLCQLSHIGILNCQMTPTGFEPVLPPWKGDVLTAWPWGQVFKSSSPSRARTYNPSVNSRVLYHWAIEEYHLVNHGVLVNNNTFDLKMQVLFYLYLQNFTQKASNLTPSNNQRLFQSKLYSLLCMP